MPLPDLAVRSARMADGDLRYARLGLDAGDQEPWAVCFHAQQAAEKWLKAVIAAVGTEPPYTHNLVALKALLPPELDLPVTVEDLGALNPYAATTRYALSDVPDEPEPTLEDARTAVAIAEAIGVAIRAWLDQAASSRDTDADPADGEDWDKPEVRGGA